MSLDSGTTHTRVGRSLGRSLAIWVAVGSVAAIALVVGFVLFMRR